MPPVQAFAFPLLLAATYGIYRVGRGRHGDAEPLARVRLVLLAILAGIVVAIQVRLAVSGHVQSALALWVAALSIAAVIGLVGLNILDMMEAREAASDEVTA